MSCRGRNQLSIFFIFVVLCAPDLSLGSELQQTADPTSPRFQGVIRLQEMIGSEGEAPLRLFIKESMARSITDEYGESDLMEMLRTLRSDFAASRFSSAMPEGPYTVVMLFEPSDAGGASRLTFEIEAEAPHRFVYLDY